MSDLRKLLVFLEVSEGHGCNRATQTVPVQIRRLLRTDHGADNETM